MCKCRAAFPSAVWIPFLLASLTVPLAGCSLVQLLLPNATATPRPAPTSTPTEEATQAPLPSATRAPTATATPEPTATPTITPTATPVFSAPLLMLADYSGSNITGYTIPAGVNGNLAPEFNLEGPSTGLSAPIDLTISPGNLLFVLSNDPPAITVYNNSPPADGDVAPLRTVAGASTTLNDPRGFALDTTHDVLYVSNHGTNQILAFSGPATGAFDGDIGPTRVLSNAAVNGPWGLFIDGSDNLYVANLFGGNVLVFEQASTLNGNVPADRIRTLTGPFVGPFDVFVTSSDQLFVSDSGAKVMSFAQAASLDGAVTPATQISPLLGGPAGIAVDSGNRLYVALSSIGAIVSFDHASTATGAIPADRTVSGGNTLLRTPYALTIRE